MTTEKNILKEKIEMNWNTMAHKLIKLRRKLESIDTEIADILNKLEEDGLVYLGY